jgi:hypothetical protein
MGATGWVNLCKPNAKNCINGKFVDYMFGYLVAKKPSNFGLLAARHTCGAHINRLLLKRFSRQLSAPWLICLVEFASRRPQIEYPQAGCIRVVLQTAVERTILAWRLATLKGERAN